MTVGGSNEWDAGDDPGPIPPRAANPRYRLGQGTHPQSRRPQFTMGTAGERPGENRGERLSKIYWKGGNGR